MNFQSLAGFTCRIVLIFAVLSADAVVYCQLLQVRMQSREPDSNSIGLECRETFVNGTVITTTDIELFLYNDEGQQVKSLLGSHAIVLEFTDGVLTFDIEQDIEGCYYCSRDPSAGVPASFRTILGEFLSNSEFNTYQLAGIFMLYCAHMNGKTYTNDQLFVATVLTIFAYSFNSVLQLDLVQQRMCRSTMN